MGISFREQVTTGNALFDHDLRDLQLYEAEGQWWLYAINGQNGGLSRYQLDADAAPVLQESQLHGRAGAETGEMLLAEIAGSHRLLQLGTDQSDLTFYRLRGDASLAPQSQQALRGAEPGGITAMTSVALADGQVVLYGVTGARGRLEGWRLDQSGALRDEVGTAGGDAAYMLPDTVALAPSGRAGAPILLAAVDGAQPGLRSYHINPVNGALSVADQLGSSQGLAASGLTALETFEAYGQSWALLGAGGSGTLSLLRVGARGQLTLRDQVNDTLDTRFGGLQALNVVPHQDRVLVLAAGADDGLSLLEVLPTGHLVQLEVLPQVLGGMLEDVTALESLMQAGLLHVFASSEGAAGVAHFTWDPSSAAVVTAGAAGERMQGSAARDVFLPEQVAGRITIQGFTPDEDVLDLSLWAGLRSPAQLQVTAQQGGVLVRFGETTLRISGPADQPLQAADLWPGGRFAFPDRVTPGQIDGSGARYGSAAADQISGGRRDDMIQGLGGEDQLRGRGGNDTLDGGDGADRLAGQGGNDRLEGGHGVDLLRGGAGRDWLDGGAEADWLQGQGGNDRLWGNAGADTLRGGGGRDRLEGGSGNDRLVGDRGNDRLRGGEGADVFIFARNHGRDRLLDFTPGEDLLDLRDLGGRGFGYDDLEIRHRNGNTLIDTGAGEILLEGLRPRELSAEEFLF